VIILGLVVAAGWVLLNRTTFGRRTVAIGGNPEAARLAGINVKLHTVLLYALSGLCCGIAALMLTSQATSAQAAMANLYELDAIAAAIIGGTLLSGGRGTIIGALFGVLVFSTITNLFAINNLSTEVQNMVKGGIIVAAVLVQQFRYKSLTSLLGRKTTS
jgi:ribose transport system permease protein